jgi:hypothetical protein
MARVPDLTDYNIGASNVLDDTYQWDEDTGHGRAERTPLRDSGEAVPLPLPGAFP